MNRNMLLIIICALGVFILSLFTPWWIIYVWPLIVLYFGNRSSLSSFFIGFISVFLVWCVTAFFLNMGNDSLLSAKIGELFGGLSPSLMVLFTGIFGGIFGGLAGLTSVALKNMKASIM